jgi:hypothetical protein
MVGAFSSRRRQLACSCYGWRQRTLINWARTFACGSFCANAMYATCWGWPAMLEYVSRKMLVFHSQLVVSGWPVPINFAWRRSSSCCVRSLSACNGVKECLFES